MAFFNLKKLQHGESGRKSKRISPGLHIHKNEVVIGGQNAEMIPYQVAGHGLSKVSLPHSQFLFSGKSTALHVKGEAQILRLPDNPFHLQAEVI